MTKSRLQRVNQKIAEKVVDTFGKIESAVVGGYTQIEDGFVGRYLVREGETTAEAKERLKRRVGE